MLMIIKGSSEWPGRDLSFEAHRSKWTAFSKEHLPRIVFLIECLSQWYALLKGMTLLLMVRTVYRVFLVFAKRKTIYFE